MEKQQAQRHIQEILGNPFNRGNFENFARNLLNKIEPRDNHYRGGSLWEAYREHITQYWRIGKYTDPNGDSLDILIIETKSLAKLDRARTSLRNFVVRHLKEFDKDYALAAFYAKEDHGDDWRFSFIKVEPEAYQDEKGKVKTRSLLSPAKRYSFLVGKHENSYTAQNQLMPLLEMDYADPTLAQIESAFSVEKVTNEFFQQYKDLYLKLFEHLSQAKSVTAVFDDAATIRFTKKLLGQIVFLYFLQKKGWLGVLPNEPWGKGDRHFLRKLFEDAASAGKNFYAESLQFLFYEALAHERKNSVDPAYYPRFDCKIPFLNGGLFEADYDWRNVQLIIPNELFRNQEKNKAGDTGTGILDVFDRYNFTIKEDEPLEKEVAVDPEMLGKVFENMLEIAERKSKGAFYTPREIVHYMCQESLIHYLDNALNGNANTYREFGSSQTSFIGNESRTGQLNFTEEEPAIQVPRADLETLIRHGVRMLENDQRVLDKGKETDTYYFQLPASVRVHAVLLDEKLATIKICDPAIGSGAFPVGLLHEVVNARMVLQPFIGASQSIYALKRHAIQTSIYGVDIDASAIDIARLRLWLSLIVDEEDFEKEKALPNLDYKIVQGNSLIGFPEKLIGFQNWNSSSLQEIADLQREFFVVTNQDQKEQLKAKIDQKINDRLKNSKKVFGYEIDFDFRLFFSEVWHDKGGFDVVIGNPPYISHDKIQKADKQYYKETYGSFEPFADLYCYFIERSINIQNDAGTLAFITSNSYLRANYGKPLRTFISHRNNVLNLINIDNYQLFDTAIVNTAILISQRGIYKNSAIVLNSVFDGKSDFYSFVKTKGFLYTRNDFNTKTWSLVSPKILRTLRLIENEHQTLEQLDTKIRLGIATGSNEAFVIDHNKRQELIEIDPKNAEIIKPLLRGRDIQRFHYILPSLYLLLTKNGINVEKDYPSIYQYFDSLGTNFKNRGAKGQHWTNLRASSFFDDFKKNKIIWIELADKGRFALCNEEIYLLNSAYFLLPPSNYDPRYILAILNSSIIQFFLASIAETSGMGTLRWFNVHVKEFPVAWSPQITQDLIGKVCDYVISIKQTDLKLQSAYFEQLIDGLVYELYFPDEIKAAKKEILAHLGNLKPITDDMSDEAKLAIIQSEFDRLYDPNHPVRNHLETLDSVEEVRIIQEALK